MSDLFRTGLSPQKADKGLRGIGLFIIVLAFLFASNKFVSSGSDDATTPTTPAKPPVVLADAALAPVLGKVDAAPRFTYFPATTSSSASTPTSRTTPAPTTSPAATTAPATSTDPVTSTPPPATTPPPVAGSDVVVTANAATMTQLVNSKQCAAAVTIATDDSVKPPLVYRACAVMHGGQVRASAQQFIGKLTGLSGRVVLVDAGFDLPDRAG